MARRPPPPTLPDPPHAADGQEHAPGTSSDATDDQAPPPLKAATHLVVAYSRGFAWVHPLDLQHGLGDAAAPRVRCQCRPGVHAVVGDRVEVMDGYVTGIETRTRMLARAVGPKRQLLAANVDRVLMVVAAGRGLREGFVMRGLVACAVQGLTPVVVINKVDQDQDGGVEEAAVGWERLGVKVLRTSAVTGAGMDALRALVANGASVMLGHSGVGKSTLINLLRPDSNRRTGGLDWQGKGRHVTTMAEAILTPGSALIDLPGIRELGLWNAGPDAVLAAFPDVAAAMVHCRFKDCTHGEDAQGCGVQQAMDEEKLDPERVLLCLRMQESVAQGTEGGGRL